MSIEIMLNQVLIDYKLDKHGVEKQIAEFCKVHRHTIGKLKRGQMKNPSLSVLDSVCSWLIENGVPYEELPGALLAFRPPSLWRATGSSGNVAIYIGMYVHDKNPEVALPAPQSVARFDGEAFAMILSRITSTPYMGTVPSVRTQFVPFHYSKKADMHKGLLQDDAERAQRIFRDMRDKNRHENVVLLGSQRVNFLLECMVADLFNFKPFEPVKKKAKAPFYFLFRKYDQKIDSAFGGHAPAPSWLKGSSHPGTYYLTDDGTWKLIKFEYGEQDAGIVIISRQGKRFEMAAFGFSGRATRALAKHLLEKPEEFWPWESLAEVLSESGEEKKEEEKKVTKKAGKKTAKKGSEKEDSGKENKKEKDKKEIHSHVKVKGREVGVYVCNITFAKGNHDSEFEENCDDDKVKVIPMPGKVLAKYMQKS